MRLFVLAMVWLSLGADRAYAQDAPAREPASAPAPAIDPKEVGPIASYGIGLNMGRSMKADGVEIDLDGLFQGIRDGAQAAQPKYTEQQIRTAIAIFQRDMQAKSQQQRSAVADKNQREGQAFLARNKTRAGIKALPSGLQYEVLRAGNGASPKGNDKVKVHYEGSLLDGTVFDSSVKRKEPAVLRVRGVIPGWTEALQLMKVGDKWRLYVPSELAYGAEGAGRDIGPNATLVFEVELLGIEPPLATDPAPRGSRVREAP